MARPKIAAGEVGQVQVTQLANGKWRTRARMRDDSGELVQLRAEAVTEAAAREELLSRAKTLTTHTKAIVTAASTIQEATEAWLPTVKVRAENGTLSWSTYENYETTVRLTLVPVCGGVTLEALTVGRCDRIIQNLLADRGVSAARKARSVLSLICGFAVRDDAIPTNPARDVTRLPTPEKKTSMLTPQQIEAIRDLMTRWRETEGMGPRPNWRALVDGMDIMLGTSARVGECIGLRRCDVDMTTAPPTILIDGTVIQNKVQGVQRKNAPKRTRQRRRVALPALAADAMRRRLALAERGPEALLFPTKTGKPMSVSNYERLLRSFIDDNRDQLVRLGVEVDEYSTHIYRRTGHHRDTRGARGRTHDRVTAARARERDGHPQQLRHHRRASRCCHRRHPRHDPWDVSHAARRSRGTSRVPSHRSLVACARGEVTYLHHKSMSVRRRCGIPTTVVAQILHHHEPRDCRRCQFATTARGLGHLNFGRPDGSVNLGSPD
ncbi:MULTISPECIES: tyrosine-type recombinase/integrase [Microbacterium]|uniref:tyrosine-type recombinase/integrase n=1 Tax=Microbacterium TaxID=33882 RepID=UPI00217ECFCF|nr:MULTISPECIES: tyrosine-type recombinase/integrase [Microbacterium]